MKIAAEYSFEAAHKLPMVPDGHKCKRLHGHNYRIVLSVSGEVQADGFIMDYAVLDAVMEPLLDQLDHHYLNEIEGLENPTSEVLVAWLRERISCFQVMASKHFVVRLYETPRYWVEA